MMNYRSRGALVLQRPNQLQAFLMGLTGGLYELGQGLRGEQQRKKSIVGRILEAVTTQNLDPRTFATPEGQAFLKNLRVDKEEPILGLLDTAKSIADKTNPEVGPPAPFTLERFRDVKAQEEYTKKIDDLMARERIKEFVKKEFETTPEMTALKVRRTLDACKGLNIDIQDLNIGGINVHTAYEKMKRDEQTTKEQDKLSKYYETAYLETSNERTKFIKALTQLNDDPQASVSAMADTLISSLGLSPLVVNRAKMIPRKQAFQLLINEFNRNLTERNKDIRTKAIRARIHPDEIKQIDLISEDILEGPGPEDLKPEETKTTETSVVRDKIIPPRPKEEPKKRTEAEYQEYATVLKTLGWGAAKLKSDAGKKLLNTSADNGFDDIAMILKYLR